MVSSRSCETLRTGCNPGNRQCEVTRLSAPDSRTDDPRWDCVHFRPIAHFKRPVGLEECKHTPGLEEMVLINNSRLSVQPVRDAEWRIICALGGVEA